MVGKGERQLVTVEIDIIGGGDLARETEGLAGAMGELEDGTITATEEGLEEGGGIGC